MSDTATPHGLAAEDLVGQVADEFIDRLDRGESPDVEEYARRFPQFAVVLRDVLSTLQVMRRSESALVGAADPGVPADQAGRLGDFRIVREVGRGGMGVVYEAEQISLGRRVALKVLPFAAAMDARQLARFRTEAQAAAHLHHTNIVPVYAVGNERGVHYYAMQFIDGRTLAAVVRGLRADRRPAPPDTLATPRAADLTTFRSATGPEFFRAVARIGAQAAEALEHAHQMGVVHRDVKPGNLLVDAGGHLWVTDFGLARLSNDAGLTRTGDLLGTLRYMSPEQTQGKPTAVDHRTDVYSLGASLYELLTLEPPFRADQRADLLRVIAEDDPAPPRQLGRAIPAELETVVLKAMAKSAADRYATAQELADDLRRFLDDKPVLARRPTILQRLRRRARRHRAAVWAAAAAGVVAVLTGLAALAVSNVAITGERDKARNSEADRTRQLYDALVAQAQASRLAGRLGARAEALAALEKAAHLVPGPDQALRLRNEVIAARTLPDVRVEREWDGHPRGTRALAFDADIGRYARCEPDGTVVIRRVADDGPVARLEGAVTHPGQVFLRFAPGERYLSVVAPGAADGSSAVWDLATGRPCLPLRGAVWAEFSPDGRRVAVREKDAPPRTPDVGTARTDGPLRVLEVDGGREVARFTPGLPAGPHHAFAFDPHGRMLAVRNPNGREVEVWHLACLDRPWKLTLPGPATGLGWHPSGKLLAVGVGHDVLLWGLGEAKPRAVLEGHHSAVVGLTFAPDGSLLATTSFDATVRLWDTRSGRQVLSTPGVLGLWFDRSGGRLAFADGTRLVVARVVPPEGVRTLYLREDTGTAGLDVSPDGRLLAAAGLDGVRLWDLPSGREVAALPIGRTAGVWFHPDGTRLTTGGYSPLRSWPIAPDRTRLGPPDPIPVPAPGSPINAAQSGDGRTLLAQVGQGVVVLNMPERTARRRLQGPKNLWNPQVSPDGRWVAVGCWHGLEMRAWDGQTGRLEYSLPFPITSACRVQFSPDGRWLVAGTGAEYVGLSTDTWQRAWTIPRANAGDLPGVIAFSRDGRLLAVAHSPVLVKLYRAGTTEELATLPAPDPHLIGALGFSPDGTRLVAGTEGNRLFVWDLRAVRAGLVGLGLDWDLPPLAPDDGPGPPVRVDVDPGEAHPVRRQVVDLRRALAEKPNDPSACNNLAWALVTGPDDLRDPDAALALAETAVRRDPRHIYLNTLGVVYYRLGRWADAVESLTRSVEANGDATAFDTIFLAMCHHHLGEREKARAEYARAVRWMELTRPDDEELIRFRAEAEELLDPIDEDSSSPKR